MKKAVVINSVFFVKDKTLFPIKRMEKLHPKLITKKKKSPTVANFKKVKNK